LGRTMPLHLRHFGALSFTALIFTALTACPRGAHLPSNAPRSVAFGEIAATDTRGCFEFIADHAVAPRGLSGVSDFAASYEPPLKFELIRPLSDVPTQQPVAKALSPDSTGARPVGWFASSREELVIAWSEHKITVRRYPDGALRANLNGRMWLVQRRPCEVRRDIKSELQR
jgi:hypothetical protein